MSEGSMKEMGELLRKGARMMSEACPECGTPLFRLKSGEIVCPSCNRPVKMVKGDETQESLAQQSSLEATLRKKITEVQTMIEGERDPTAIRELTDTLMALLGALERVKKLGA
ncbi:MAG: Sjogren's syndrome/scleroderma autoantigen 1 family protein [Candidatus Bathyarchaeota archaeon]